MKNIQSYIFLGITLFLTLSVTLFANDVEYSYVPKKVYEKQVFPISFLTTNKQSSNQISFNFLGDKKPILEEPVIIRNGAKTFYTFYFKTTEKVFQIPKILVQFNGQQSTLNGVKIPVKQLPYKENFSGVIASGLKVKNHQVSTFDETSNLIAISLEAHDAHL